ncbi:S49 family peptidase [uncultured Desulfuromusa sp.]|uniref:S49 family peptidase n=1 Tax=uncultured Desulfuromusa sp. TaxID=219183 RepID=UPI002AA6C318|nr:S49 family peptidase [uncultured Desulfuromusa sp.]
MTDRIRKTALQAIMAERWAITEPGLRTILAIANREGDLDALKAKLGEELPGTRQVEMRGNVAVVPISGPIFRYANLFTEFSGATSLGLLTLDFQKALQEKSVKSILLWPDSPGGQVNGTNEYSDMVYQARKIKPVYAYVGGTAASAAYWDISGCQEIIVDETACLGSIGVVATYQDDSKAKAAEGIETIEIVSSASPNKRPDLKTEEGRSLIKAEVDALADVFIAKVAKHRGVSDERVRSEFGQGGVFIGADAVDAGLADRIGSFEEVVETMQQKFGGKTTVGFSAHKTIITGGNTMDLKEMKEKYPEQCAALVAEGHKTGHAEGLAAGITAEVERVKAVRAALIPGHEELIEALAADGKTTGAEAALAVNQAENQLRQTTHKKIVAEAPKAPNAAEPGDDDAEARETQENVSGLVSGMNKG